jgi:hypothetical protein
MQIGNFKITFEFSKGKNSGFDNNLIERNFSSIQFS